MNKQFTISLFLPSLSLSHILAAAMSNNIGITEEDYQSDKSNRNQQNDQGKLNLGARAKSDLHCANKKVKRRVISFEILPTRESTRFVCCDEWIKGQRVVTEHGRSKAKGGTELLF